MKKTTIVALLQLIFIIPSTLLRIQSEEEMTRRTLAFTQAHYQSLGAVQPGELVASSYLNLINFVYSAIIFDLFQPLIYVLAAIMTYILVFNDTELQEISQSRKLLAQVLLVFTVTMLFFDTVCIALWYFFDEIFIHFLPIPSWFFSGQIDMLSRQLLPSLVRIVLAQAVMMGFFSVVIMLTISYFRTASWGTFKLNLVELRSLTIVSIILYGLLAFRMRLLDYLVADIPIQVENLGITSFRHASFSLVVDVCYLILISVLSTSYVIPKAIQLELTQYRSYQLLFVGMVFVERFLTQYFIRIPYTYTDIIPSYGMWWLYPMAVVHDILITLTYACLPLLWIRYQTAKMSVNEDGLYTEHVNLEYPGIKSE